MIKKQRKNFKALEVITAVFMVAMISVFLLGFTAYTDFTALKDSLFFTLCGGYGILLVVFGMEGLLAGMYSLRTLWEKLRPDSWTQYLLLGYLALSAVSSALSEYPIDSWLGGSRTEGFLTLFLYVLCFYGVSKFANPQKWMFYLFGGALTLFSILGILQLRGLNPFGLYPEGMNYFDAGIKYAGKYLSTIGNIDLVAAFLSLAIPAMLVYLVRAKENFRFVLLLPLALSIWLLIEMWVLAGLVGVFCGLVLALPFLFGFKKRPLLIYYIALAAAVLGGFAVLYFVDLGGMLGEIHQILHGSIRDAFGSGRIYIWRSVLERVPEHLWFGTGPDTLLMAEIDPFSRTDHAAGLMIYGMIDAAHCEYLNVLYHQGIFALIAYLAALVMALFKGAKAAIRCPRAAVFGGAVLCYCLQAFFGISQLISAPFFWIALGLLEHYTKE